MIGVVRSVILITLALLLLQMLSGMVVMSIGGSVPCSGGSRAGAVVVPLLVEGLPCPAPPHPCPVIHSAPAP